VHLENLFYSDVDQALQESKNKDHDRHVAEQNETKTDLPCYFVAFPPNSVRLHR
jgi:hypothetical protein